MLFSYYRRPLFILLLAYACGIFIFRDRFFNQAEKLPFELPRAGALIEGRISDYPSAAPGGVRFALKTSKVYGKPVKTGLMVYAAAGAAASYGDTVSMLADLSAPRGAEAPGALDWAGYLSRRGITAQARAREIEILKPAGAVLMLARRFRGSALHAFREGLPPEEAAVFGGIVLGEKKSVPADLKTAFQNSGAMHLLVTSGAHVGFVAAVIYFLCARLRLRRSYSGAVMLGLTGFYVLAAGLGAPLVRAYLMLTVGFLAWLARRESGAFQALCAAALVILIISPLSLFDAGFQMSFLAAYGLTVGLPLWRGRVKTGGLGGKLLSLVMVSFFAQLCLYPLLALYFHKISLVSLLSNMLLVPASGVAMALGFALALSGSGAVFRALAGAAGFFMDLFIDAVRFFAGLPHAAVTVPEPSAWLIGGSLALAAVLLHAPLLGFKSRRLYISAAFAISFMLSGLLPGRGGAGGRGYCASLFGDTDTACALVSGPGGLYLVNPGMSGKKLAAAVLASGSRCLEGAILTSLEPKNYSGLEELSRTVAVRKIFLPPGPRPPALSKALKRLTDRGAAVVTLWPGEAGASLDVVPAWDGYAPGYSGRGDRFLWEIGPLRVGGGGTFAELACEGVSRRVDASKGETVSLEFELPRGGCGDKPI